MLEVLLAFFVSISAGVVDGEQLGADWEAMLVGGPFSNEGRLEVRPPDGEWGSVCYRNTTDPVVNAAAVRDLACGMCQRMGYLASYVASNYRYDYGTSSGVIWFNGGSCSCGLVPCDFIPWTLDRLSCDHRSDISMTCLTVTARLSNGSSEREGWLEVGLGGDRWVSVVELLPHALEDADLVCQQLGFPLALSLQDRTDLPSYGSVPEWAVRKNPCRQHDTSIMECLGRSVCNNNCAGNDGLRFSPVGVKCAQESEVLAQGDLQTPLPERTEFRLDTNGTDPSGILQLRREGSTWGYACFYDSDVDDEPVGVVASGVCRHLSGFPVVQETVLIPAWHNGGVEYLFRVGRHGKTLWLQVQNHCARNGGKMLTVSCKKGFTSHGITVLLPDGETCEGRCGRPPVRWPTCGCDPLCHALRDCCFDVLTVCPPLPPAGDNNQQQSSLHNLTTSSQYYECLSIDSVDKNRQYQLISECPESWPDEAIREYCEIPHFTQPILYQAGDSTNIPFKNTMCALCHGFTAVRYVEDDWMDFQPTPNVLEIDNNTSTSVTDDLPPPDSMDLRLAVFAYRPIDSSADRNFLHACTPEDVIGECPSGDSIQDELREACAAYSAEVHARQDPGIFKNPHCALCNGITIDDIVLSLDIKVIPPILPSTEDIYEVALAGVKLSRELVTLKITLGQEIQCRSKDFEVSVVRAHATNDVRLAVSDDVQRRQTLTAFSSMECLLHAVAFSNIDIVADFGEVLTRFKILNNNTTDTARVTKAGFAHGSALEAALNCILQISDCQGNGEGPDWRRRCNSVGITLKDECLLDEDNANGECFQTSAADMTAATINGTLFLYIDNDILITPLNISFFTTYEADDNTANFTQRKVVQACGVRPKDISCEVLSIDQVDFIQVADSRLISHRGLLFNESSYVILPDGDVMVCTFTKISFEDPFSGPEYVVNVVCLALSLTALAATIVTYCVFPTLRNVHGLTVISLSAAIFVGQALFLFGLNQTANPGVCAAVAITAHYAWLAAFAWMTALAWDLMRTFSGPANRDHAGSRRKYLRLSLFGWCSPFLVLIPCLVVHFCDCTSLDFSYGSVETRICWISDSTAILVFFGLPIALSLCANVLFFLLTVKEIRTAKKASSMVNKDKSRAKEVFRELLIYVKISSAMGFAWIIGFVALATDIKVLWYLFIILGSLQGIFIFTSFACNSRVRGMWRKKLRLKKEERMTASSDKQTHQTGASGVTSGTASTSV